MIVQFSYNIPYYILSIFLSIRDVFLRFGYFVLSWILDFKRIPTTEVRKFLSTGFMFFFIALSYAIGRRLKDVVISTKVAVEIITFIKPVIVLPAVFIISFSVMYAINHVKDKRQFTDKLVYFVSFPFMVYYIFYGIIDFIGGDALFDRISPNVDLCKVFSAFSKISFIQLYLYELSMVLNKIFHVLFYTCTELYGALVLSYSFWTFVNTYTSIKKAAVLYPQYTIFSSFSVFVSGLIGVMLPYVLHNLCGLNNHLYSKISVFISILLCVTSMSLSIYCYRISLEEHRKEFVLLGGDSEFKIGKSKVKISFFQSIVALLKDRIVMCLFICVVSYMTCINLVEITWKKAILNYCSQMPNSRMIFDTILSCLHLGVGIATIIASRICIYTLLNFGWLTTALISPMLLGGTGVLFFIIVYLKISFVFKGIVFSSYLLAVIVGMFQNISSKACKYSFFDGTKELGYLYLPKQKRDQSKSAIDMLGGRFGKSFGSIIQQCLFAMFVTSSQLMHGQEIISSHICWILIVIVCVWLLAVLILGSEIRSADKAGEKNAKKANEQENNKENNKAATKEKVAK